MANILFRTKDRDASHRALEYARGRKSDGPDKEFPGTEILANLNLLQACCTEADENGDYCVWDGNPNAIGQAEQTPAAKVDEDDLAERIANKVLAKLGVLVKEP